MKRCYIGVGGIGCRQLKEYEKRQDNTDRYVYMDAVSEDLEWLEDGERYALTKQKFGCFQRIVGKDEIKAIIYDNAMPKIVDEFFLSDELEVVFVTSTFGGFGSAAIYELSDYYGFKIRNYRRNHDITSEFSCKVIAFPLRNFGYFHNYIPENYLTLWAINELEFINEFRSKESRADAWYKERSNSIPFVELYVPFLPDTQDICSVIALSDEELKKYDIKKEYYVTSTPKTQSPEVFISYSSKDQDVADMLIRCADQNNIRCWIAPSNIEAGPYAKQIVQGIEAARVFVVIVSENAILSPHVKNELDLATNRIPHGLIIMPFKIDNTEYDAECRYYLGRHELFKGNEPPMEERIAQFVGSLKKILSE